MTLVGPRPHAVSHDEQFARMVSNYRERFSGRPGVTGLAQVSGSRGLTPTVGSVVTRTKYDLEYVRTASLWLDLKIIALTVKEVFSSKSAF